jgi:hypothetical protein
MNSQKKELKRKSSRKILIVSVIFISLIGVFFGITGMGKVIYNWYIRDPLIRDVQDVKALEQISPVSEWHVYSDPQLHVSFKYPSVITLSTLGPKEGYEDYRVYAVFNKLHSSRFSITSYSTEAKYNERFKIGNNTEKEIINGKTFYHGPKPTAYYFYRDNKRFLEFAFESYYMLWNNEPRTQKEIDKILEEMKQTVIVEE